MKIHLFRNSSFLLEFIFLKSAFNVNVILLLDFLFLFLWNCQSQDSIFIFCMNVFLGDILTNIEASAHISRKTFFPDILAVFFLLILIYILRCIFKE